MKDGRAVVVTDLIVDLHLEVLHVGGWRERRAESFAERRNAAERMRAAEEALRG